MDNDDDDYNNDPDVLWSAGTNVVVNYPPEACARAILEDSQDGLETQFEKIRRAHQHAGEPAWVPFGSLADWELSQWLIQSGVSQ